MEEIYETMMDLGRKFAKQAGEATSAKSAKTAFDMAEKAFRLAMQVKKSDRRPIDFNYAFLSQFDAPLKRSDLWREYLDFCSVYELEPISKGELFAKLARVGFVVKKGRRGDCMVHPPKSPPRILQVASELLESD